MGPSTKKHCRVSNRSRVGFTLIDVAMVVIMIAVAGAIAGPVLSKNRGVARNTASEMNLRTIGAAAAVYQRSHDDRIFDYSWRYPGAPTVFTFGEDCGGLSELALSHQHSSATQARDILMRWTGRCDGEYMIRTLKDRFMPRRYLHLILADFLGGQEYLDLFIDPSDAKLQEWRANPLAYEDGSTVPYANGHPGPDYDSDANWNRPGIRQIWTFSSSYLAVPAVYSDPESPIIPFASTTHVFETARYTAGFDGNRYADVRHPSGKVMMYEEFDREQVRTPYFAYEHARPAKLMFDGSINTRASGFASSAENARIPGVVWRQRYVPLDQFPVPVSGLGETRDLDMRYMWTRGGLKGIDYPIAQEPFGSLGGG